MREQETSRCRRVNVKVRKEAEDRDAIPKEGAKASRTKPRGVWVMARLVGERQTQVGQLQRVLLELLCSAQHP